MYVANVNNQIYFNVSAHPSLNQSLSYFNASSLTPEELCQHIHSNENAAYHIGKFLSETLPFQILKTALNYCFSTTKITPAINLKRDQSQKSVLTILQGRHLDASSHYVCTNLRRLNCYSSDPDEQQIIDKYNFKNKKDLFFTSAAFELSFLKSLPFSKFRMVLAHGNINEENIHTMNFLKDNNENSLKIISSLADKQEILFIFSCHSGALHRHLNDELGNSLVVTFTSPENTSLLEIYNEIMEYISYLISKNVNPKNILPHIISRFPVQLGIKMPGKESHFFETDLSNWENRQEVEKLLIEAANYLEIDSPINEIQLEDNLKRRKELGLFEYLSNQLDREQNLDDLLEKFLKLSAEDLNSMVLIDGYTPLHVLLLRLETKNPHSASYLFCEKLLEHWIAVKANISQISSRIYGPPLHYTLFLETDSIAKKLLAAGANVNLKNNKGETAFLKALKKEKFQFIPLLLEAGADINTSDLADLTPLHVAISHKQFGIAEQLIGLGANIKAETINEKITPLLMANEYYAIRLLVANGADINYQDKEGHTFAYYATFKLSNLSLLKAAVDLGANVNLANFAGETLLHNAARLGNINAIKILSSVGADFSLKNKEGVTASELARKLGNKAAALEIEKKENPS